MDPLENVKVVIAEDETGIRNLLVDIMEMFLNRKAIAFENGLKAWQYIHENPADVIISDVDMPGMNGLELLRMAKSEFPDIIFICMSGNAEYEEKASKLGANHFIEKPFEVDKFVRVVKKYITGEEE